MWRKRRKKNVFLHKFCNKMEKFKYISIDDEYPSHLLIKHHVKNYTNYEYVAAFFNPETALLFLQENDVDLIFLDIEMPEMNGFQLIEALPKSIFVVILTAYQEKYSLEAHQYYDKNLVFFSNKAQFFYYLPKIITRFEAVYEERKVLKRVNQLSKNEIQTFPKKIDNKTIQLTDIIYFTAFGHNIVLRLRNGEELICRMTLRELLGILPSNLFFRIRRNIVINAGYVTSFTNTTVCIDNQHIMISERNRKEIGQALQAQKSLLYKNY